jgi:hypothetical protein
LSLSGDERAIAIDKFDWPDHVYETFKQSSRFHSRERELLLPPPSAVMKGFGVADAADLLPPATDRLHRKGRSVVIHPDADPAVVSGQVINPVWHRSPQLP